MQSTDSHTSSSGGPLRILFVSREYPPETGGGGIGSYVETMAQALAELGNEVHVLSCSEEQASEDRVVGAVHLHRRGVPRILPKVRRRLPSTARRLEGAVARYREYRRLGVDFDVVEAPDWLAEGLMFSLLGSRPLVVHLHTPFLLVGRHNPSSFRWTRDGHIADWIERLAVRRADLVTSPSRLLADDLAREGWIGNHEPWIIRYPLNPEPWADLPPAEDAPARVLAVGRLEGRKAPEVLVRAAAILAPELPDFEAIFVGRSSLHNGGSYKDWLVELARRLSAPCRFIEEVRRDELTAWYGSSRVVALPSRYDNFPYVGLEAMAAARPLVCTNRTGTAEFLTESAAGTVVPADDAEALASALRPFLHDPAVAGRGGREALALVGRECSPERIAEQREACYREAMCRWATKRRAERAVSQG